MKRMTRLANWKLRHLAAAGLMLAATLLLVAPGARAEDLFFDVPAVVATAKALAEPTTRMDADFFPFPLVFQPKYAFVRVDEPVPGTGVVASGSAQAAAALNGYMVVAHVNAGLAVAEAYMSFSVQDPQQRDNVKLTLKFKGDATTGARAGTAEWQVSVGAPLGNSFVRLRPDGTISFIQVPSIDSPPLLEVHGTYSRGQNNPQGGGAVVVFRNGQVIEQRLAGSSATDDRSIDLTVRPDTSYLMAVVASAVSLSLFNSGVAVVDPVVLPHPDNPDVVVQINRGAVDPTPRSPLAGITAEQLAAEGLDIEPLRELGFFDSPAAADTTPPTTIATPSPGPNASGWNRSPVAVNLNATDNAGGSGVKEIHVALSGATIGQQVVAGGSTNVAISAEGTTTLTYFGVDNAGNQEAPKILTVKIDQTPPVLAGLPAASCTLWPPDHRLVQIASITASDGLSGLAPGSLTINASSNEPATGTGKGGKSPDVIITGGVVQLRAERAPAGNGRIYSLSATATDLAGNVAIATRTCKVPHDQGQAAKP